MPGGGRHTSSSLSAFRPGGSSFTNKTRQNFVMKNLHVDNTSTSTNKNTTNLTATNVTSDKVTVTTLMKLPVIDNNAAVEEEGLLGYVPAKGTSGVTKYYISKKTFAENGETISSFVWSQITVA
jgi:hypothetical protein